MTLKLYHNTDLGKVNKILSEGLIPGGSENWAQYWESYYHKTGVYFVHAIEGYTPADRMNTDMLEILDCCGCEGAEEAIDVVLYVELPIEPSTDYLKLVPDEEIMRPNKVIQNLQNFEFCVNPEKCESVVYLGKVNPEFIKAVYIPLHPKALCYVAKHVNSENLARIKFLLY